MDKYSNEDVAIVGMGLRFPGDANSPESFYEFLVKGRSALSETPSERYNVDSFYHPDRERPGIVNTHHAHYINGDIAAFDAPFFSITPNEAVYLDPQQRGLLEATYHALENAGIPISKAVGSKTAVYMGCFTSEYEKLILSDPEMDIKYTATGVPQTLLSNRLSWFYDFRGPSLTIDTACSSSLNAVHLGCNSLLSGEADMAVVGGCNLMCKYQHPNTAPHAEEVLTRNKKVHPVTMLPLTTLGFLSPDGKCYSFDHRANGYSRGEGFGVIAMKRVLDAVRDGDTIRAVIRGTASNQDGKSPGITQPTRQGQEALIKAAYARAGLGPDETRFFEAHGTGTPIGDPLEAGAISACFSDSRSSDDPIYVGALKTNVGHLEGAAGVAGLIKAALVVERGLIPPNLNMEKINPKIPAEEWNMNFPSQLTVWPSAGLRRASVNSFGFGGSNAHAIVDDAYHYLQSRGLRGNHNTTIAPALPKGMPEDATRFVKAVTNGTNGTDNSHGTNGTNGSEDTTAGNETNGTNGTERKKGTNGLNGTHGDNGMNGVSHIPKSNGISHAAGPRIFLLSSNDENGISRLAVTYRDYLTQQRPPSDEESYLRNLSYTLATKRTHFPWRAFIIADCVAKLTEALCEPPSAVRSGTDGNLALVFTGQGAQWRGMGQELLRFPRFRESILAADTYLKELGSSWSVRDMHTRSDEERMLKDAEYSQPLCTILQVALVDLMSSWSIQPGAVVGHSSGEIAAAYAAGAISRESAWRIAYYRGLLSSKLANQAAGQQSAGVGMMAVGIDAAAAQEYINSTGGLETIQELTIACFNSPKSVTVSGTVERLDALQQRLTQDSIFNRRLQVENAYHSPLMHSIANEYRTLIGSVEAGSGDDVFPGATPRLYSSLTGRHASLGELQTAAYWVQNLVSPVRFSDAVSRMLSDGVDSTRKLGTKMESPLSSPITELVEVGPHSALQGPLREILGGASASKDVGYATVLRRGENAISTAMLAVGWLYCRGQPVDIERVNSGGTIEKPTKMLVDLPPYPFNHGNTYWRESRLSKGYRFRAHPRHELLGAPVPDWDKNNAMWRNWLRLSENPWVKDHVVAGNVLYPAAGMIVMAIEAMRQLASPDKALLGLRLKDVIFQTALRVPESVDGVETHFNVRPYLDSVSSTSSSWNEFQLSSNNGEGWREHCRGLIQPVYETAVNPVDNGREREQFIAMTSEAVAVAESRCRDRVPSIQVYELLHTIGFDFGKTFQNLTDIAIDTDRGAVATIKAPDTKSQAVAGYVQPHLIHPCTLDAIFQSTIVALTRGGRELGDAVVPTSIKKLWIAVEGSDRAIKDVRVSSKSDFLGMRQMQAASTAVHPVTRRPLLVVEGFEATAISNSHNQAGAEMSHRHLCFNHVWQPDVDIINQEMAVKMFRPPEILTKVDPTEVIARCEALCYLYLRRYLKVHDDAKLDPSRPWYRKYVGWMHHQFEQHARGELVHARDDWDKLAEDDAYFYELEAEMAEATPEAVMTVAVGRNLEAMLQGALDPLEVFFNTPILEDVYARGTGSQLGYSYIVNYLDNLAHKNSDISILEVGAGTGGATVPILDALTRHGDGSGVPRFGRYDFTDISPSFFDQAKKKFSKTADRMRFRTLNIEKDSFAQGFEPQMYDAIIAANVLHATKNIDETLRNCRKMLKPGGKLILNELTNPEALRTGFGFGLLPGWWLSEEPHRQWGPLMTAADWETHLKRVGFSGVDIYFQDYYDKANHLNGVLVATALGPEPELRPLNPVVLVYDKSSRLQAETAVELKRLLSHRAPSCTIVALEELAVTDLSQKVCIFLPELDSLFLDRMDEAQFASLKRMTSEPESLIWITHGGGPASQNPNGDMVNGLAKVVRQENPGIRFVTLAVETVRSAAAVAETALTVIHSALAQRPKLAPDNSFWESDGVLHICRLVEDEHMNQAIAAKTSQQAAAPAPFGADPDRALKLTIGSPGLLDTLQFVDDPRRDVPLAEGEVEFKIAAAGLNFLDVMTALGQVVGNNLGCEGAGVVTRTGPNCTLRPGDRVCGIGYWLGAFGTYSRSSELCLARVPDSMSLQAAAGFAVVFVTAYMALYEMANIQKGETVLIHAAAGGVGQACIQLAKLRGAVIFATVGSTAKRDLLMDTYGIPKEHILASRDLTFAQGIRRLTRNRGVDVVVNSLSGDALRATWECMAPFGRFIEVGKVDIYSSARLDMSTFRNNVSFSFIDVSYMCQYKPERFGVIMGQLMQLVEEGHVRELAPITSFSFAQIQDAFRYMQGGSHSGKIVLEPHDDDIVPIVPSRKDLYSFDPEASYLISGGLGGLGRSIARWMASRGAKNLILLSRSGNTNDASRTLVADLEAIGVRAATPPCDVTDATALQDALDRAYADGMPLVKGCIQGSMVLKDALLVNMTLEEYYTAVKPKVHASWNLHNVLPKDLDFFVLLSSISTVWGNRGQANYNIGNAFQDALARYRVLNGWRAHVIDVGMILSVGYVAENKEELVDLMRHIGAEGAREEELHAILNEMCEPPTVADGEAGPSSLLKTQVSLGLQLPEARMLAGLEPCGWMSDPLVRVLHQIRTREGAAETERKTINYGALLSEAASFSAACDVVYDALADKLIKLLNISADDIDPGKPLHDMGVDSLVSVELRTWIMKQLDADVAVFDLMETSSMRKLALLVASRSGLVTNEKNKEEQTA